MATRLLINRSPQLLLQVGMAGLYVTVGIMAGILGRMIGMRLGGPAAAIGYQFADEFARVLGFRGS